MFSFFYHFKNWNIVFCNSSGLTHWIHVYVYVYVYFPPIKRRTIASSSFLKSWMWINLQTEFLFMVSIAVHSGTYACLYMYGCIKRWNTHLPEYFRCQNMPEIIFPLKIEVYALQRPYFKSVKLRLGSM